MVEFGSGLSSYALMFATDHITSVAPPPPLPVGVGDWVRRSDAPAQDFTFAEPGTVVGIDTVGGTDCAVQWPGYVHRGGGMAIERMANLRVVAQCKAPASSFALAEATNGKHQ